MTRKYITLVLSLLVAITAMATDGNRPVRIGIAWQQMPSNYKRAVMAIEAAGGEAVILDQMRPAGFEYEGDEVSSKYLDSHGILLQQYANLVKHSTYLGTNIDSVMQGIQAVVFLGGGDISPTLFATPEPWHGIEAECNYETTRDLSEYLTMTYCLDRDIPVLGLCRGMQLLGVVSGAPLIQDLGTYFRQLGKQDHYVHRSDRDSTGHRHYTAHDVTVTDTSSIIYSITASTTIHNTPSWHHQAVGKATDIPLKVTAVTRDDGVDVIEAIERTDKTFALGVQFHPEEAVRMHLSDDPRANQYMTLEEGLSYFKALVKEAARFIRPRL